MSNETRAIRTLRRLTLIPLIAFGFLSILATGGGGGSGGGGGGSGGGSAGPAYKGNTDPALVTATNATRLIGNVIGTSDPAAAAQSSPSETRLSSQSDRAHRLHRYLDYTLTQARRAATAKRLAPSATPIDETEPCPGGGSIHFSGSINDDGTGILTATYNDCQMGAETLNGQVTLRVDAFDFAFGPTNFTFTISNLTLTAPDVNETVGGSLRVLVNISTKTETDTFNMVTRDNISGEMTKAENLVFVAVYNNIFSPSSYTETINGRVFDSVYGFVDVATVAPLIFSSINQLFPDSGQLVLIGAANARIRVTALSAVLVNVELDLDGDGVYELAAILRWTDLGGPVSADVGDDDGDGMHNSWESVNGLDPTNPADAFVDNDGDGFTNLKEYLSGSDVNDPASTPPPEADLAIAKVDLLDPVAAFTVFDYDLTVSNAGPSSATNVRVDDTLPAGSAFVNATGSGWFCNQAGSVVTCTRSNLPVGVAPTITISLIAPDTAGSISNTATVSSGTADPNTTNNTATEKTEVVGGATRIRQLTLTTSANDIVYDTLSGRIYASVPSGPGGMGGSIAIIDPIIGQVETWVAIGTNPGPLAVSDDGQFLYVGLNGTSGSIRRFDIASRTAGPEFLVGSDPFFGPFFAEDIEVLPGNPSAVAVSRYQASSPRHAGVAIYDDGVQRPATTPDHTGSNVIEFRESADTLYGYNNETTEYGFRTMSVDADGVTVVDVTRNLISGFGVDIEYDGGRIYSTTGRIVDPVNRTFIGAFPITSSAPVEPDAGIGRVFFVTTGANNTRTLQAFDANSLDLVGAVGVSGVSGNPTKLIRWGSNGLAFATNQNQLFLIETALVP